MNKFDGVAHKCCVACTVNSSCKLFELMLERRATKLSCLMC